MKHVAWYLLVISIYLLIDQTYSSRGDRDITFYRCMVKCPQANCNGIEYNQQNKFYNLLGWDCETECRYSCMWETVNIFEEHGLPIPQFYGKWPFLRVAGIQEIASVVASILNILAHVIGILALRKQFSNGCPLYWFWHSFAIICINGWIWSTVFHTRDTQFTEVMDYVSAFSMVMYSFFSVFVRMFEGRLRVQLLPGVVLFLFLAYHVYYLTFIHFDYGYNMKTNIVFGILNAVCWISWCWTVRKTHEHVWKCVTFIILALASISLEVLDFPPIYWILDAHALWHFSTALITPIWYRFLLDDCQFLEMTKYKIL